jgi:hypothetical protein
MLNLYYNGAVNGSYDTLGNWWLDDGFTIPATALPATGDTIYISASVSTPPSTEVTLNHIYIDGPPNYYAGVNLTGITGDATVAGSNYNYIQGALTGNVTFYGTSFNNGTITGDTTFYDNSSNWAIVNGNATFNDTSYQYTGTVNGNATFNDFSMNTSGWVFGDATFNDYSSNYNNMSSVPSVITGNAIVNYPAERPLSGTVTGFITYVWPSGNSGNGVWGNIYYIDDTASTLDQNGDGRWNGFDYIHGSIVSTIYYTNTSGNGQWSTLTNWNSLANGSGSTPPSIPWTNNITAAADLRIATQNGSAPALGALFIGNNPNVIITGDCDSAIAIQLIDAAGDIISQIID